jgi:cytochrome d ubiquinol oxidase subunit I
VWVTFVAILVLYVVLGATLVITLRAMARRWRATGEADDDDVPYGPDSTGPPAVPAGSPG